MFRYNKKRKHNYWGSIRSKNRQLHAKGIYEYLWDSKIEKYYNNPNSDKVRYLLKHKRFPIAWVESWCYCLSGEELLQVEKLYGLRFPKCLTCHKPNLFGDQCIDCKGKPLKGFKYEPGICDFCTNRLKALLGICYTCRYKER